MRTITIDIINEEALLLLKNLEMLKLIRLRKGKSEPTSTTHWLNYKGAMSKQPLDTVNQQLNELRDQWE